MTKTTKRGLNKMKYTVQAIKSIEDGKHFGKITALEERTEPYKYTDVVIELENGSTLKAGYPSFVSEESKLGLLLTRFGAVLAVDEQIDLASILIGSECQFLVQSEETPRGTFAKVIPSSVKPK